MRNELEFNKVFDSNIYFFIERVSTLCDSLSEEYKNKYKSEVEKALLDYITNVKNGNSLLFDSMDKLAMIEVKVDRQLIREGKTEVVEAAEAELTQNLEPVFNHFIMF